MKKNYFEDEKPIGWLLTKVAAHYEKEFLHKLNLEKQFGSITAADHRVLRFLTKTSVNSKDIANQIGISKQAISKTISSLEERGFISKKDSATDRRAHFLMLTEKGERLIAKAVQVAKDLEQGTIKKLGAKDLKTLKDLLLRIAKP
jgi:DNA-binding MarR family transcriptional regulator